MHAKEIRSFFPVVSALVVLSLIISPILAGTPEDVVTGHLDEWSIGGGFIYWAYHCHAQTECPVDPFLKRRPVGGGEETIMTTIPGAIDSFLQLSSDEDGAYTWNVNEAEIEYYRSLYPTTPPIGLAAPSAVPVTRFVTENDRVFWGGTNGIFVSWKHPAGSLRLTTVSEPVRDLELNEDGVSDGGLYFATTNYLLRIPHCATWPDCSSVEEVTNLPVTSILSFETRVHFVAHYNGRDRIFLVGAAGGIGQWYTAPDGVTIHRLATDGENIYWIASSDYEDTLNRKPYDSSSGAPIDVLDFQTTDYITAHDPRIAIDGYYVYYRLRERPLQRLPLDAPPLERDLAVNSHIEVTQGVQSLNNDVPLVAGKGTFVRVWGYAAAGPSVGGVDAQLDLVRDGVVQTDGRPLLPINGSKYLPSGTDVIPDRTDRDSGWLFYIPEQLCDAGDVTLRILIDPARSVDDEDFVNNGLERTVQFITRPPSCVVFIPVHTHAPQPSTKDPNTAAMWKRYRSLWPTRELKRFRQSEPVEELEVCTWGPFPYPCWGPYELPDDSSWVLAALVTRDTLSDDPDVCDEAGTRTQYVGMVHPDTNTLDGDSNVLGMGNLCLAASWVKFAPHDPPSPEAQSSFAWPQAGHTLAHEGAHNFHRLHVDCGGPADTDPSYPYFPCGISFDDYNDAATHFGFDPLTEKVIFPDEAGDLMSYASSSWISDWTYKHLFTAIDDFSVFDCVWDEICGPHDGYTIDCPWEKTKAYYESPQHEGQSPWAYEIMESTDVVLISGVIGPGNKRGKLNTIWVYPSAEASEGLMEKWGRRAAPEAEEVHSQGKYNYKIRCLSSLGFVLDERAINPRESISPHSSQAYSVFDISFPKPDRQVATIQLMADNDVLDSVSPGLNSPSVSIIRPSGGENFTTEMAITWTATDPDSGDHVLATVQYSPDDGENWTVIADRVPMPPGQYKRTLNIDLTAGVAGSDPSSLIRVLVTDGFNTAVATSQRFQVTNRRPDAVITAPEDASTHRAGQPILISGEATDAEDGNLPGMSLSWTIDGTYVGRGSEYLAEGLAPGIHTLHLEAFDSAFDSGRDATTFDVAPLDIPSSTTAPKLDGMCHEAQWAGAVTVPLESYGNGQRATAHLLKTSDTLWVCLTGLARASGSTDAYAGIRIDPDYSRDATVQTDDYTFGAFENGTPMDRSGEGSGGFAGVGPGGLEARISSTDTVWTAELKIDGSVIGGLDHAMGIEVGHYDVSSNGDNYMWPFNSRWYHPTDWAATALGKLPSIDTLLQTEATAGSGPFWLQVNGHDFDSDATVYLDGEELTSFVASSEVVLGTVEAEDIAATGLLEITVINPSMPRVPSNSAFLSVKNPKPSINTFNPGTAMAGGEAFTLEVHGSDFRDGAVVLWNGEERPTTFGSTEELRIAVRVADLAEGHDIPIQVFNPDPAKGPSEIRTFHVYGEGLIFADTFESGSTTGWSLESP